MKEFPLNALNELTEWWNALKTRNRILEDENSRLRNRIYELESEGQVEIKDKSASQTP